jgi:cathepsin L
MKKVFVLVALCLAVAVAIRSEIEYKSQWAAFVSQYEKTYSDVEAARRFEIFKRNVDYIDAHNNSTSSFTLAINKFADMSFEEFKETYLGVRMPERRRGQQMFVKDNVELPASLDWRTKGAVTGIKNQQQCGSCWSFSTTGSVEGCHFLTTGKLVSLSEQNLVDCSQAEGNMGCDGGLMDDAFQYIIDNKGIDTEASYPYTAEDGTCHYSKKDCGSTVTAFTDVTSGSEDALQQAVNGAPVSVAIDASQPSFQFYSSGVYYEPDCSSQQLDHGVLAVGWGSQGNKDYWIVKNSWGTSWGQSGYIWMSRNKSNNCGIATMASFPTGCNNCAKSA